MYRNHNALNLRKIVIFPILGDALLKHSQQTSLQEGRSYQLQLHLWSISQWYLTASVPINHTSSIIAQGKAAWQSPDSEKALQW